MWKKSEFCELTAFKFPVTIIAFIYRFLIATEARPIPSAESNSNAPELSTETSKCDNVDQSESVNGTEKRKCSEAEEQEPKRKKYDKKNRGQNKVEFVLENLNSFPFSFYADTDRHLLTYYLFIRLGAGRFLS